MGEFKHEILKFTQKIVTIYQDKNRDDLSLTIPV